MKQRKTAIAKSGVKAGASALVLAVILVMTAFSGEAAHADEGTASYGRVDPFTGQLVSGTGETAAEEETIIWLTDIEFYDNEMKMFGFETEQGIVYSSVPDGMITRDRVVIYLPEGLESTIYMDGLSAQFTGGELSDAGGYTVEIVINGNAISLFSFTIAKRAENRILSYTVPEGMRIYYATRDNEEIPFTRTTVDMSEEGRYIIRFDFPAAGLAYTFDMTVDTTPPEIEVLGVDEQGRAKGPVSVVVPDDDDTLSVTMNGEPVGMLLTHTFTKSGKYVATVTDPAGNYTQYPFTIMIYIDRNGWIFFVLLVLVIGAVAGFIFYKKKHLRVR